MRYNTGEDVDTEKRQRHNKQVEVTVIPLPHTVADPRTVVVKPF